MDRLMKILANPWTYRASMGVILACAAFAFSSAVVVGGTLSAPVLVVGGMALGAAAAAFAAWTWARSHGKRIAPGTLVDVGLFGATLGLVGAASGTGAVTAEAEDHAGHLEDIENPLMGHVATAPSVHLGEVPPPPLGEVLSAPPVSRGIVHAFK